MIESGLAVRIFLPVFFVVFILVAGPLSALAFRKKYGFDPMALAEPDPIMDFGESYRDFLFGCVLLMTITHAVWPQVQEYLGPIRYLERPGVRLAGVSVLVGALILVRVSQLQLKSSWRFGVDRAHPPDELVTAGVFAVSRNPIFLGMLLTGVGLFLALPNAVSFAVPNLAFVLLQTRIRVEEAFLEEVWGGDFLEYRKRTPRWLIGPRR